MNPGVIMTPSLYATLVAWVDKHYRDRLSEADLADPQLLVECRTALDELSQILKLGSVYPFQRS
ncbi:N-succinylarginine dihydrolase [compost metagenome]